MGIISYLITMFVAMFWVFRVAVAYTYSMGINFITVPMDLTVEIIILFITLFSFIFIIKRNIFGAIIYFATYSWYFGTCLYNGITLGNVNAFDMFIAFVAIVIAILNLIDILLNKNRTKVGSDYNSGWFYKDKKFDRNFDERVDKNQYKF